MKNVYLRIGSYLTTKCYYCGEDVEILSDATGIIIKKRNKSVDLTNDEDDAMIFMSG